MYDIQKIDPTRHGLDQKFHKDDTLGGILYIQLTISLSMCSEWPPFERKVGARKNDTNSRPNNHRFPRKLSEKVSHDEVQQEEEIEGPGR